MIVMRENVLYKDTSMHNDCTEYTKKSVLSVHSAYIGVAKEIDAHIKRLISTYGTKTNLPDSLKTELVHDLEELGDELYEKSSSVASRSMVE